jgi:hypothetical protein
MTYSFSDLFFTGSATFSGTPLDGHETLRGYTMIGYLFGTPLDGYETLGGYTMIDYLSVYVSRRHESLQSYTSPTTYLCMSLDGH